jgi:lantibiotic biosynthesis protein
MTSAKRSTTSASRHPDWQPIATGALARHAKQIALAVGRELAGLDIDRERDVVPGLYLGHAGLVVLFDYLHRIDRRGGWHKPRTHHLAKALEHVSVGPLVSLHFGGLGVAWLLERVGHGDQLAPIDQAIIAHLRSDAAARTPYHVTLGLSGIAIYALERGFADRDLRRIAAALAASAVTSPKGTTWKWQLPRGAHYNLGMLTGVPGVIGALGALGARLGWPRATRTLFSSTVRWLRAQRLPSGEIPPRVPRPRSYSHEPSYHYGDVGLAGVLAAVDDPEVAPLAAELAERAVESCREPRGTDDLTLSHGAAGVVHVFNRLAHRTGDPMHRDIAARWLAHVCSVIGTSPRSCRTWSKRLGFIDGAAGTALVLAAAVSNVEPSWDRVLLLSRAQFRPY